MSSMLQMRGAGLTLPGYLVRYGHYIIPGDPLYIAQVGLYARLWLCNSTLFNTLAAVVCSQQARGRHHESIDLQYGNTAPMVMEYGQ